MKKTLHRIARMERAFDELSRALASDPHTLGTAELRKKLHILTHYYESGAWLADYERDERGELPRGVKRGVLSQDGVYDLLAEISHLSVKNE